MPTKIEKQFEALAKAVHAGKLTPGQIDNDITSFVADSLLKGVYTGFNSDFDGVDYKTPDFKMLSHLEKNVYYFSGYKNYHEVLELNEALRDGDRVRSFKEFKEKAASIHEKYNANYLQAEYNHAVASSQMARQWVDIQDARRTHPLLRYSTVGDDRVRIAHKELEGVTKPIDDKFWDSWYPPNGWGCRCDVQQVQDGKVTNDSKVVIPEDVPDMFKTNTAKQGMVYPPKHPYYALPDKHVKDVLQSANDVWKSNTEAFKKIQSYRNGGSVEVHGLADQGELAQNTTRADLFAKEGYKTKVMPHVLEQGIKNPEVTIDDVVCDFKTVTKPKASTIQHQIEHAKDQRAEGVVLFLHSKTDCKTIQSALRGSLLHDDMNKRIQMVYLVNHKNIITKISRSEIKDWSFWDKITKVYKTE